MGLLYIFNQKETMAQPTLAFHNKLLSLCLPTYNRADCIYQQLKRLQQLSPDELEQIEIIISDNCSPDHTRQTVEKFSNSIPFIYLRNSENIGPDGNFLQCLRKATGKYVWLLGDDDYLRTEHIHILLDVLKDREPGLLHIGKSDMAHPYTTYDDIDTFLSHIGVMITFMSGNIFLREAALHLDYTPYEKTNLLQVPMYLSAALSASTNIIMHLPFYDAPTMMASNGGYNLIRVFVVNLSNILDEYEEKGISPHTIMMVRNSTSDFIAPYVFNYMILRRKSNFALNQGWSILRQYLGWPRLALSIIKMLLNPQLISHVLTRRILMFKELLCRVIGRMSLWLCPVKPYERIHVTCNLIASYRFAYRTPTHVRCYIERPFYIFGPEYIRLGQNFSTRPGLRIECLRRLDHDPVLIIGNNVTVNFNVHIGVIDRIEIGNNVLIGSNILITDHSHGNTRREDLDTPPGQRPIVSKGPVIIEDNVWIGENVSILQNVRIGHNSIIGANAVVTKDVPPYSKVIGNPMQIIPAQP